MVDGESAEEVSSFLCFFLFFSFFWYQKLNSQPGASAAEQYPALADKCVLFCFRSRKNLLRERKFLRGTEGDLESGLPLQVCF